MNFIASLDKDAPEPLYAQIGQRLRDAIASAEFAPHTPIPTERELAEGFGVSRITVRKALGRLESDGLLYRRQGAGTFVADRHGRIEKSLSRISSFSDDMRSRGLEPSSQWISKSTVAVTPEEALALGLSPGAPIHRFIRVRFANGLPMAIETATVPAACLGSADDVGLSLYEALDRRGLRPAKALQRLRAVTLDKERAALLGVDPGSPALLIERRGFSAKGLPMEITTSYYRGDAYDFLTELSE